MADQVRVRRPLPVPPIGVVPTAWSALWISLFAFGDWQVALLTMFLTPPVSILTFTWRRTARRKRKAEQAALAQAPVAGAGAGPAEPDLVGAVALRASASNGRFDPEAVRLIRELVAVLQPLLLRVRQPGTDAAVRHDAEAIAGEHLPAALDAYLALPPGTLHLPSPLGPSPAVSLRDQLALLLDGCKRLAESAHRADLARQQELGRFLDAKFRRSDLDL